MAGMDAKGGSAAGGLLRRLCVIYGDVLSYSLRGRVMGVTGLLLFLAVTTAAIEGLVVIENQLIAITARNDETLLRAITREAARNLQEIEQDLVEFGRILPLADLTAPKAAAAYLGNHPGMLRLFDGGLKLFSPSAHLIAQASGDAATSQAERAALQAAAQDRQIHLSKPYSVPGRPHAVRVAVVIPILRNQAFYGLIEGVLDLRGTNVLTALTQEPIGEGGYAFLASADGQILVHPDAHLIMGRLPAFHPGMRIQRRATVSGTAIITEPDRGEMIRTIARMPRAGWLVGLVVPKGAAFAALRRARHYVLFGALLALAATFLALSLSIRRLMAPLEVIARQVRAITTSGHSERRRVTLHTTSRELKDLAQDFNAMLDRLDARRRALLRSQARLRKLLANTPDVIIIIGEDGRLLFVSPSAFDRHSSSGDSDQRSALRHIHPDDADIAKAAHRFVTDHPASVRTFPCRVRHKDGTYRHYTVDMRNRIEDPDIRGILVSARDETDRKLAEDMLRHAQRMGALGNLTGGIAHDFNTHLGIIQANLECIRPALNTSPDLQRFADNAAAAVRKGEQMTRSLLSFGRHQQPKPIRLDIWTLLEHLRDILTPSLAPRTKLVLHATAPLWACEADEFELQSAIINLVMNGRDAMGGIGTICLHASNRSLAPTAALVPPIVTNGDYVAISVSDTGIGMDAETIEKAFEPFFTTKPDGTGLGLSMVHGFVHRSGGHIGVDSAPANGTTVTLYLRRTCPHLNLPRVNSHDERTGTPLLLGAEPISGR